MLLSGLLIRGGSNPILRNAVTAGQYDSVKTGPRAVVKWAAADYRMWYESVKDDANQTTTISYATSTDGTTWTKSGSNPLMSPSVSWEAAEVSASTVFWDADDSVFKMYYHGGVTPGTGIGTRKLGYATSSDGLSWTKSGSNPILSVGAGGSWESLHVVEPMVIKINATDYRMWYRGIPTSGASLIGYATSTDGVSWTKYGSNPVFGLGTTGQWDDTTMQGFTVLYVENKFHAWYIADNGNASNGGIGYASSLDGITWTRGSSNPVLNPLGGSNIYSPTDVIGVYLDTNRARVLYGDYNLNLSPVQRGIGEAYIDGVRETSLEPLTSSDPHAGRFGAF